MPIMMIFVLLVIALIVISGLSSGRQLQSAGVVSSAQQQVGTIVSNIQSLYANNVDYSNLSNAVACSAQVFPQGCSGGQNVTNPFGGGITVWPDAGPPPDFNVALLVPSNAACVQIATSVPAWQVSVWNQSSPSPVLLNPAGGAVSPAAAQQNCTFGSNNIVDFKFLKTLQ